MDAGWAGSAWVCECVCLLKLVQPHSKHQQLVPKQIYREGQAQPGRWAADNEETLIKDTCAHMQAEKEAESERGRKGLLLDHMVILEQEAKVLLNIKARPKTET